MRRLRPLAFPALALAAMGGAALLAQEPQRQQRPPRDTSAQTEKPRGTATIAGRVAASDSGRPLKRARVAVVASELPEGRAATTNEEGRYEIKELPAGSYRITASKPGFVAMTYGQRRPLQPGTPLKLRDDEQLGGVDFRLPRGSVITGHVLDDEGEPLIGVVVRVLRYQYLQGQRRLTPVGADQTDDRGEYRVFGLQPGDYYVSAVARPLVLEGIRPGAALGALGRGLGMGAAAAGPGGGRGGGALGRVLAAAESSEEPTGYAPTYYPGVADIGEAGRVTVGVGQEATSVDFGVQLVPTANVRGTLAGPDGGRPRGARVVLMPEQGALVGGSTFAARPDANGEFTLTNVPPGRYVLRGWAESADSRTPLFATHPLVVVGRDVSSLTLLLSPGATLSGAVSFESTGFANPPGDPRTVRLVARSVDPDPLAGNAATTVRLDGRFVMDGVPHGARVIRATGLPRGWSLKAVMLDGRDVADTPLEFKPGELVSGLSVTFTDRATDLSGTVVDDRGEPVSDQTIVAFSAETADWQPQSRRVEAARPDQGGRYQIRGLPAGEYFVAAVEAVEQGEWYDAAFLEPLRSSATRVTLADGDSKTQDVKIRR